MLNLNTALYTVVVVVVVCSLATAGCQPAEGPLEKAGKSIDQAGQKVGNEAAKAGEKIKDAVNDAKK
jgi:predicted small secreted protein